MRKGLKDNDSVVVQGWMVSDLGLKSNSLLIYAIIYGYSQGGGDYHSGYRYLADFAGCSTASVMRICKDLVERGLLTKEIEEFNNNIIPHFRAVKEG